MKILGEDVDLLVLFLDLKPLEKNIFFMKPIKGRMETIVYLLANLRNLPLAGTILFLYAFIECDSTSAKFNKGTAGIMKTFTKFSSEIKEINNVFSDLDTTEDGVASAEEKLFLLVYKASEEINLNQNRHTEFIKALINPKSNLAVLSPTKKSI